MSRIVPPDELFNNLANGRSKARGAVMNKPTEMEFPVHIDVHCQAAIESLVADLRNQALIQLVDAMLVHRPLRR
ncbi:hypothetical protein HJFPF1_09711 [Paramyrothecium foliicola]|nr:hypothetical protein HJFPF1_09711 [Paramyrothecium foliicola]